MGIKTVLGYFKTVLFLTDKKDKNLLKNTTMPIWSFNEPQKLNIVKKTNSPNKIAPCYKSIEKISFHVREGIILQQFD